MHRISPLADNVITVPDILSDMNRHFSDARYYARRTAESTYDGLREELEPVVEEALDRVYEYRGVERQAEPTRIEHLQAELDDLEERAEGEARDAIQTARQRLGAIRSGQ